MEVGAEGLWKAKNKKCSSIPVTGCPREQKAKRSHTAGLDTCGPLSTQDILWGKSHQDAAGSSVVLVTLFHSQEDSYPSNDSDMQSGTEIQETDPLLNDSIKPTQPWSVSGTANGSWCSAFSIFDPNKFHGWRALITSKYLSQHFVSKEPD